MTVGNWFEVDKDGLKNIQLRRGIAKAVVELVSNALDAPGTKEIAVHILLDATAKKKKGKSLYTLQVIDDSPDGFVDLREAWTLFAPSRKIDDPTKRGRFNLGEKLVLSLCEMAVIDSTTGSVCFDERGRTLLKKRNRTSGTEFTASIYMTTEEAEETRVLLRQLIIPSNCALAVDGNVVQQPECVHVFTSTLPTEIADEEGVLRRSQRQTTVLLFEPGPLGAWLYELGVPVVELPDERWSINVEQKVPLNAERDNVTPAYLKKLRTTVLDNAFNLLSEADAAESWVEQALEDANPAAVQAAITKRFGEKRAIFDPSDPEASARLVSEGYTILHGRSLSSGAWSAVKRAEAAVPAGQIAPTTYAHFSMGGTETAVDAERWTPGMKLLANYAQEFARVLLRKNIEVRFFSSVKLNWAACYGPGGPLCFNIGRLGRKFVDKPEQHAADKLLLHEFAHEYESNHLSTEYHEAICDLGAKMRIAPPFPALEKD